MTSAQQDRPAATSAASLTALRGNCMGAAVLLVIQFGIGIGVNLYITVPKHKSFLPAVFGSAMLAAHAIVSVVLLGAAIGALVRAIRSRKAIVVTSAGLAAGSDGASLAMALAAVVAMFCYLAAVFSLR